MKRFPASLYQRGTEPDPRFSLANERTFLAWIRTSLALVAAGVALEALKVPAAPGFRLAASLVFIALGLLAAANSWFGWLRAERSLRENRALPGPSLAAMIALGVIAAAVLVTLGLFL